MWVCQSSLLMTEITKPLKDNLLEVTACEVQVIAVCGHALVRLLQDGYAQVE